MSDRPAGPPVRVVPYDEAWPRWAAAELATLTTALGDLVLDASHIGSTSIPQMAAKNILDLQLSVWDLDEAAAAFDAPLAELGYVRLPYERDHVPAGDDSDPGQWVKRYWHRRNHPGGDVNLHVRVVGSLNERLALLFRDYLRAHPLAVAAYSRFKQALAAEVVNLEPYTDIKDPVVDLVVAAASDWASAEGWQPHAGT
ncbi:MAG TPA: GrpB family protein [Streptosporangiaceae bacterium]|nr:GrpB family protein [Streptosporangiaceae bacterium]